jgi:pentatricopeptide repeat protein
MAAQDGAALESPPPLADYFVVVGLNEEQHPSSKIWDAVKREGHVCEICTVNVRDADAAAAEGWVVCRQTPTGRSATVNFRGMFPEDVFLCYRKGQGEPITDVMVVHEERGEAIPAGFLAVAPYGLAAGDDGVYDLSQKSSDRQVVLCASRALNRLPLRDLAVVRKEKEGFGVSADYSVDGRGLNLKSYGRDSFVAIARVPQVCYTAEPSVLCQFPETPRPECPMPGGDVSLFCMPTGVNIAHHFGPPLPTFFSFCLTVTEEGQRMYGCCVTFYEPLQRRLGSARELEDDDEYAIDLYTPKCMCLLSRWPFFDAFREFLVLVFTLSQGPNAVSIERRLYHLLYATPMPSYGTTIRVPLESSLIKFKRPPTVDFPLYDTSMMPLFRCLDIDNVLLLFKVMLLEQKIVMHSKHKSLLLPAAETLCAIIFPFKFQHVYIPVMPTALADYLQAPVPYLIGMPTNEISEMVGTLDVELVTVVDLDRNSVRVGTTIDLPDLPTHCEDVLRRELQLCASIFEPDDPDLENADLAFAGGGLLDRGVHTVDGEPFESRNVRSAFLRFFLSILRDYRCCLRLPFLTPTFENIANPNQAELFADGQFRTHHHPPQSRPFIDKLLETQSFMRFVEERTFPSTRPWDFVFFDQCIDTGVHDPPEGRRQRIFSVNNIDEAAAAVAGSEEEESYSYRPFVLKQENFKLSEAEAAEMRKKSGTGDVGVTPIVGLDTVTMQDTEAVADRARRAAGEAARRKLERPADVVGYETAKSLPEIIHGCWFLLYRSYVRRKSEKAAQGAIAEAKAVQAEKVKAKAAEGVQLTRQERVDALKEEREEADDSRTASASKGLHVSFEIISQMHEAQLKVHSLCYRSLMEICGHSKLADTAKLVFEDMMRNELVPDTISYNAFVNAIMADEDQFAAAKFKAFRPYRCLPDQTDNAGASGAAAGGSADEKGLGGPASAKERKVELRLCTEDGLQLGAEDEALALAVWGVDASIYDDCLCLPPLFITVKEAATEEEEGEQEAAATTTTTRRYAFVSPFTLSAELEGLLAHWGDSLVTVVALETELLRLRQEHPTVRRCCPAVLVSARMPTSSSSAFLAD